MGLGKKKKSKKKALGAMRLIRPGWSRFSACTAFSMHGLLQLHLKLRQGVAVDDSSLFEIINFSLLTCSKDDNIRK